MNQNFYACHNNSNGRNVCYDFSKTQALNNLKNSSKKRKVFTSRTSSECLMYVQFTFCVYWIGNSMIFGNSFGYLLWGNSVFICLMCLFSSSFPNKNKTKNKRIIIFKSEHFFKSTRNLLSKQGFEMGLSKIKKLILYYPQRHPEIREIPNWTGKPLLWTFCKILTIN